MGNTRRPWGTSCTRRAGRSLWTAWTGSRLGHSLLDLLQPVVQLVAPYPTADIYGGVDGCPTDGNLRVRYGRKVRYGYPDALIVCGQHIAYSLPRHGFGAL